MYYVQILVPSSNTIKDITSYMKLKLYDSFGCKDRFLDHFRSGARSPTLDLTISFDSTSYLYIKYVPTS